MRSSPRLAPSVELGRRATGAALAYTLARMKVLESIPGNPIGIAYRTIGDATALSAHHLPSPSFNRVVGLRCGQTHCVQPLVEWHRERGERARFEIAAGDYDAALGRELTRWGFYQSGFHAALIREPETFASSPSGVSVELVASAPAMEDFLEAYVAGWSIAENARAQFKANVRPWLGQPGWSLYLARIDGRPAAAAILFVHADVGYFADAATGPGFRKLGIHSALLRRRLQDASEAGVDFVCGEADYLSTSHRNMERAGMRLLLLRAVWTPLD